MVQNLKSFRRQKGISQQQLADAVGVSQQSINKYENHSVEPDISTLIRLSDFFETSVDALIGHVPVVRETYALTPEEGHLVNGYRILNETEKEIIRLLVHNHK